MGNCCRRCAPAVAVADDHEAVILVVGNETKCKARLSHEIAIACGAAEHHVTKAGVSIHFRNSAPETPVVIDTVPLSTVPDFQGALDTARIWVSRNALRKLSAKRVFVVVCCVIDDSNEAVYRETAWLHLLACVFEKHKEELMILVQSENEATSRSQIRELLKRDGFTRRDNISFVSFRKGADLSPAIKELLRLSRDSGGLTADGVCEGSMPKPFILQEVTPDSNDKERLGPWGPDNVILFGMSGSGKSTLAQMLTRGRLEANSEEFSSNSGIRGETKEVHSGYGRGWLVMDTPGLGEPNDDAKSTVATDDAARKITDYVKLVQGTYCHCLFIWKKGRLVAIDRNLWGVFLQIIGREMVQKHVTVVVSDADEDWLEENRKHLETRFDGCESFLAAEFPATQEDEDDNEIQEIRKDSLMVFEEELASLCRMDSSCRLGVWSVGTQMSEYRRADNNVYTLRYNVFMGLGLTPSVGESVAPSPPSHFENARAQIRFRNLSLSLKSGRQKLELVNETAL